MYINHCNTENEKGRLSLRDEIKDDKKEANQIEEKV